MNSPRHWLLLALIVIALILTGVNLTDNRPDTRPNASDQQPAYQSEQSRTLAYDPGGALSYQLQASHISYYSDRQISQFRQPILTLYDQTTRPAWQVSADSAWLEQNKQLHLRGHVRAVSLTPGAQLEQITTDNAQIDLITLDIASDDRVTLSGPGLHSTGLKMRGNLREKTARLIEQVKTSYETHNQPSAH